MSFWKSYCQYLEQDISKFNLLPKDFKTHLFLWREQGWILLLLGKRGAVQCFMCVAKKVTRTGPGKGRAVWQSAVAPRGVCLPCLCSSVTQQETKRSSLFKCSVWIVGIFRQGTPPCVHRDMCSISPQGNLLLFRSSVWFLDFYWGLGWCLIHVPEEAEFRFRKGLGAVYGEYFPLHTI